MGGRFPNETPTSKLEVPWSDGWWLEASLLDRRTITVTVRRTFPESAWEIARYSSDRGLVFSRDEADPTPEALCLRTYRKMTDSGGVPWFEKTVKEAMKLDVWRLFMEDLPNILTAADVLMS